MTPVRARAVDALIECVPNVSEGRDQVLIQSLGDAVEREGARLIDVHSDVDHHRSVFTYLGAPDVVERATLALARLAVEGLDMRGHRGVHPRVGAVDVVPFVPLRGTSMADAVASVRRVGRAFSDSTGVPVFFYAEATQHPGRRELPVVRWGGFEGLAARLTDPAWCPDCGPTVPHPSAGVSIFGARGPLIAFNAMLDTVDVAVAKAVAARIRESAPGGLPHVRAIGVLLESRGIAQVAMNLLDYGVTPPGVVAARIEQEVGERGTRVRAWELVGCAPRRAFAAWPARIAAEIAPRCLLDDELFVAV